MPTKAFAPTEQAILEELDAAVHAPRAAAAIAVVADEVSRELARNPGARLAWRPLPLDIYDHLPPQVASSWVFVLRAGCTTGAERHPNSIQRFMSYRGTADMQTWDGKRWVSNILTSPGPRVASPGQTESPESRVLSPEPQVLGPVPQRDGTNGIREPGLATRDAGLEGRWLSIPVNVWHRPVMGAGDWTVVSFHTAADDKLIEERPADDENPDASPAHAEPYAGRKAR